jgi:UPF0755 protein
LRAILTFILVAVLAVAGWLAYGLLLPIGPNGQEKFVMLRPGSSARHIARDLKNNGVIRSTSAFLAWHYWRGLPALKAGEYKFDHPTTTREVYDRIVAGDVYVHTVIIPEGYNIFDIANAIQDAGLGSRDNFLAVVRSDVSLISDLDPQATSLEGYLFPDTYEFTRTQSLHDMAAAMVRRFRQESRQFGLTTDFHNIVTMASIVEKETEVPAERPLVAGVFYNRLRRNTILATDPSVIYAALLAGRYNGVIHQSDLQFDSPYNTYKHVGLPPGPICNPGHDSLAAAMQPASSDFLFFVSDNNGHHRFASTMEEHSRNVAAYRRAVADGH